MKDGSEIKEKDHKEEIEKLEKKFSSKMEILNEKWKNEYRKLQINV